jgi:RNA polymerase primary sigma factor
MTRYEQRDESHDLLNQYLQEIARTPMLTPEREKELGRRVQQNDKAALEELVKSNLRFVVSYAKRYRNSHVHFLDLINEGNIGLIHAARKYDPEKNVKFITYAVWWIRQAILHALSEQAGAFRLPPKRANMMYRLEKAIAAAMAEGSHIPTAEELAEKLGVTVREIQTLLQANLDNYSLSAELDDESHTQLADVVEQTMMPSVEEEMEKTARRDELLAYLSELKPKERIVLMLRYGISDNLPKARKDLAVLVDLPATSIDPPLEAAEESVCELLQVTRGELAYLLLLTSPNPKAVDRWNVLGDGCPHVSKVDPARQGYLQLLQQTAAVQLAIEKLPTPQKVLIRLRYGVLQNEELTLREIGDFLGLSRERVRQIESNAERKTQRSARIAGNAASQPSRHDAKPPQRYTSRG